MRALTKLVASLRNRGMTPTLRIIRAYAEDATFDFQYGVRTCRTVALKGLDIVGEHGDKGIDYQPIKVSAFLSAMRSFQISPDGVFVDFGSGKGRALLLSNLLGFRRAVGIDFARELCRAAEHNLDQFRARTGRRFDALVLNIDATCYRVGLDDSVFFLYNPFERTVLEQVLSNIRRSLVASPRAIHIVYANPVLRYMLDDDPFWCVMDEFDPNGPEKFVHYQPC